MFTIGIYAFIGILSRTMAVEAYYVAGRSVPPVFNGMATAADWMSGASFVAMAGGIFMGGHTYMAFVVGWTGGYILVATLMAPYLQEVRLLHGARLHRYPLRRQVHPLLRRSSCWWWHPSPT
jgi:cation/acetate symporter